jgi:hypothetical protein
VLLESTSDDAQHAVQCINRSIAATRDCGNMLRASANAGRLRMRTDRPSHRCVVHASTSALLATAVQLAILCLPTRGTARGTSTSALRQSSSRVDFRAQAALLAGNTPASWTQVVDPEHARRPRPTKTRAASAFEPRSGSPSEMITAHRADAPVRENAACYARTTTTTSHNHRYGR